MAASPVIERDVDGLDLDERTIVAMLNNHNRNAMHLFLQYICRDHRQYVAKYSISEIYPKMLLWCEVYQLAMKFEIVGLQRRMVKRIKWRLFEFEDSGEVCKEYMDIIELVKDEEDGCWEWLRRIIVDVKWMIARERTERGITLQDELPDCMEGWGEAPLLYNSDCSGDSVDLEI